MFDVLIQNATIVDGTGASRYRADIGIADGLIAKIGDLAGATAAEVLDAEGRIAAPGIIDPHSHYDAQIFWDATCADAGQNGITTVVSGNCGFGFAPCREQDRERTMAMMSTTEQVPMKQMRSGLPWDWETFPEYLDSVDSLPKAVNISLYAPLNPILIYVMGIEGAKTRRPTRAEIARIKRIVGECMDAGAQGLAFVRLGELDSHTDFDGSLMPTDVLLPEDAAEIASLFAERSSGVVMCLTQVGQMGDREISENVARRIGDRPLIHNVIIASESNPELHRETLAWLEDVRSRGIDMWGQAIVSRSWQECDLWHLSGTTLDFMPVAREFITEAQSFDEKMAKAADPNYRARFRDQYDPRVAEAFGATLGQSILVNLGEKADPQGLIGKTFDEIAQMRQCDFIDAFFDLAIESELGMTFKDPQGPATDPAITAELIQSEHVLGGVSDGGAHMKITSGATWAIDLLIWLARDEKLVSLEDLHHRLSAIPAKVFGFEQRGYIREGYFADILVYDLDELYFDRSSYDVATDMAGGDWRRKARSGGYRWILVNGEVTFESDVRRESVPGRLLRGTRQRVLATAS